MISNTVITDFDTLLAGNNRGLLLQHLIALEKTRITEENNTVISQLNRCRKYLEQLDSVLTHTNQNLKPTHVNDKDLIEKREKAATDWLIVLFNTLFEQQNVQLVRGGCEPEYFPAYNDKMARIEFAHGFFSSALHEISHWCIAGKQRRLLSDFGYWYAPDGRNIEQQQAFERLEIKPQALECLFALACRKSFQVSVDNLSANFNTDSSNFKKTVYQQAAYYIEHPYQLPTDARTLLQALLILNNK